MTTESDIALRRRLFGLDRNGIVTLRDYDRGIVETLGATVQTLADDVPRYFVNVANVTGPPGWPGVPVIFQWPEDTVDHERTPFIMVRRLNIDPDLVRYHPGSIQYRAPSTGARRVQWKPYPQNPDSTYRDGFSDYEARIQATPFEIQYNIVIAARHRGAPDQKSQVNALLFHVMRVYPPYGVVNVKDSLEDVRGYECFNEGVRTNDTVQEIQNRYPGFEVNLRVEAELDLSDPVNSISVQQSLTQNFTKL